MFVSACLLAIAGGAFAQIELNTMKGQTTIKTKQMEAYEVDIIDGVATMQYSNSAAAINGSPFLNEEFTEGTMTILDGTEIPGLRYRYDVYGDKMQFIVQEDTATINKPLALKSIVMGERKFAYLVYMLEADRVATGYFEVLEENEHMDILLRRRIELEQDVYVANYGGGGGTKEFAMKEENSYYIRLGENAARKISNKKAFLNSVDEYQDELKQYMKKNKLSVRKANDLQAIAEYYDQLYSSGS